MIAEFSNQTIKEVILLRNLMAEMARYGVTNLDIKNLLNCSERTVTNKLNGETDFYF